MGQRAAAPENQSLETSCPWQQKCEAEATVWGQCRLQGVLLFNKLFAAGPRRLGGLLHHHLLMRLLQALADEEGIRPRITAQEMLQHHVSILKKSPLRDRAATDTPNHCKKRHPYIPLKKDPPFFMTHSHPFFMIHTATLFPWST